MSKFLAVIFDIRLTLVFLMIFAIVCALATGIESVYDTTSAWIFVYGTAYFGAIQLYLGLNLIYNIIKFRLYKNSSLPSFIFHISFIFILFGAGLTRYFGFEAKMHIRENESTNIVYSTDNFIKFTSESNGKMAYSQSKENLSPIGNNYFENRLNFGDKTAILRYKNFIEHSQISLGEVDGEEPLLGLVFSNNKNKKDVILKNNDEIIVGDNLSISFNATPKNENFIKFELKNGKFYLISNQEISYMKMSDMSEHNLSKNTDFELDSPYLFTLNYINFAVSFALKSGGEKVENSKNQNAPAAILATLEYDGKTKDVFVQKGDEGREFDIDGRKFYLSWSAKKYTLPFFVELKDFIIDRYPGSNSPSGYKSVVRVGENLDGEAKNSAILEYEIYMNHVLDYKGFRFFQESYDLDERGTILSINKDPGKFPTYFGYFLLSLGLVLNIFNPKSRFRYLMRLIDESSRDQISNTQQKNRKSKQISGANLAVVACFLALNLITPITANAKDEQISSMQKEQIPIINQEHSANLSRLVVQGFDGRSQPFDTISRDILHKISGLNSYEKDGAKLAPAAVIISMMIEPKAWANEPIIKIKDDEIKQILGLEKSAKFAKFNDFFALDDKNESFYKISRAVEESNRKPSGNRGTFDKELLKLDERVNVMQMVFEGIYFKFIPKENAKNNEWLSPASLFNLDPHSEETAAISALISGYISALSDGIKSGDFSRANEWLKVIKRYQEKLGSAVMISDAKIEMEIFFNKIRIFARLSALYVISGILLLILVFIRIQNPKFNANFAFKFVYFLNIFAFFTHTFGLALRWYIANHAPWSNAYESLIYIAWSLSLSGIIFSRKSLLSLALTSILAGCTLMVANLTDIDPQITNIMPVLHSYWLTIHVSVITASYGFLGLCALLGIFTLVLFCFINDKNSANLSINITEAVRINEVAMILGLALLTIGNFLGGVWANESWGRYWGWDSKETWALITILIYAAVLHARLVKSLNSQFWFSIFAMWAYLSVIMTYFGVNFYLTGMHTYATGEKVPVPSWLYAVLGVMCVLSLGAFFRRKFSKKL